MSTDQRPPLPDRPQQCHFYLASKKRYCRFEARKGSNYCGEHKTFDPANNTKPDNDSNDNDNGSSSNSNKKPAFRRVPCPLDPSHTVFEHMLQSHMATKCNARFTAEMLPCFQRDANISATADIGDDNEDASVALADVPAETISRLVRAIEARYIAELTKLGIKSDTVDGRSEYPVRILTHPSHNPIATAVVDTPANDGDFIYAELGAGRAVLSSFINTAIAYDRISSSSSDNNSNNSESISIATSNGRQRDSGPYPSYLLVDRKNCRYKYDCMISGDGSPLTRALIDIKDLDLHKLCEYHSQSKQVDAPHRVVAISKHLCGAATDLSLVCLRNMTKAENRQYELAGMVIALCCHGACSSRTYVCPTMLSEVFRDAALDGMSFKAQFGLLTALTSWATSANTTKADDQQQSQQQNQHYSGIARAERERIGRIAKRLIDVGRLRYLGEMGFDARLVQYIDSDTTLENIALIATPKNL
ncbi:DUF715-domain-containing protein [Ramicandelaber brevisporus]|nr:DUF715-domain-containing protein [Ramicandelaber brevisporus]